MMDTEVKLSPSQSVKLMAIAALLREGDIDFRGYDFADADNAKAALLDIGEECALQFGGA